MLSLVVTLLVIALIAALLGFGGIAGAAVGIAKIIFLRCSRFVRHLADRRWHARWSRQLALLDR
jgi:uncharacterized membrane protein YtjA (UPF0391 family)